MTDKAAQTGQTTTQGAMHMERSYRSNTIEPTQSATQYAQRDITEEAPKPLNSRFCYAEGQMRTFQGMECVVCGQTQSVRNHR